ncbi:MAG: TIGR04222 domain-containing membrane protein [Cyanobacteriota bacterium ELA615]
MSISLLVVTIFTPGVNLAYLIILANEFMIYIKNKSLLGFCMLFFRFIIVIIIIIGIIFLLWLQKFCFPPVRAAFQHPRLNIYEIAFLSGGNQRLISTVVTSLVIKKYVAIVNEYACYGKKNIILLKDVDNTLNSLEVHVLQKIKQCYGSIRILDSSLSNLGDEIAINLKRYGIFISDQNRDYLRLYLRLFSALITISIFMLFIYLLCREIHSFESFFNLIPFIPYVFFLVFYFYRSIPDIPYRSSYGSQLFFKLQSRFQYLNYFEVSDSDLIFAVALFGENILWSMKDYRLLSETLIYRSNEGINI